MDSFQKGLEKMADFSQVMQMNNLRTAIRNDVEASNIDVRIYSDTEGEDTYAWIALYNGTQLMFTVGTLEQWQAIYAAFERLFSGPSAAEIDQMERAINS